MDYQKELGDILERIKESGISVDLRTRAAELLWSWDEDVGIPGNARKKVIELFIKICLPSGIFPKESTKETSAEKILRELSQGKTDFIQYIANIAKLEEQNKNRPSCVKEFAKLMKNANELADKGKSLHLIQQETAYALHALLNEKTIDKYEKGTAVSEFVYLFHRWMWENNRVGPVHRGWVSKAIAEKASGPKREFMNFTFSDAIYRY